MSRPNSFQDVNPAESLTLVVAWRTGRKVRLRQLSIGTDVATQFRAVITQTLADLRRRDAAAWAPDADLTPETYLLVPTADLGDAPELAAEHSGQTLAGALRAAESLPHLSPHDVPAADLTFYALVVGDKIGQRAAFLRKSNPRRGLRRGHIFTFLRDTLQFVDDPIFAFDELVDLVFIDNQVAILSQSVFASIFRGQDALAAQVPTWANDLQAHVPMTNAGRQRLVERALRDSRLRVRLEAIVRRGHLESIGPAAIRAAMLATGLDPNKFMDAQSNLTLENDDIPQVLYFLNEDLFAGALTNAGFRADKKAAR